MKLDGIRVLDLSLFLPGPMLTQMMTDHGAEVIKIEPPGEGEPVRHVGWKTDDGVSVWFRNTHRGKKSLMLDLKSEADKELFFQLVDTADVLIEAFRPGVVDRLGIGAASVRSRNPRLVYCSISAFGQTGPERLRPAHDLAIEALSGVVSLNLGEDGKPTHPHMPVADALGSLTALSAVLMALLRRETTGRGDTIDLSMQDATIAWLPNVTGPVFVEDNAPDVKSMRSFGGNAFYSLYETSDGRHIALGGVERKFVVNCLTALGRSDLIDAALTPPGVTQAPVKAFLKERFLTRTRDEWVAWFADKDVCFAPVLDLREAFHQPQIRHREMLVRDADGHLHIGLSIRFAEEPGRLNPVVPKIDEHRQEILSKLADRR